MKHQHSTHRNRAERNTEMSFTQYIFSILLLGSGRGRFGSAGGHAKGSPYCVTPVPQERNRQLNLCPHPVPINMSINLAILLQSGRHSSSDSIHFNPIYMHATPATGLVCFGTFFPLSLRILFAIEFATRIRLIIN